MKLTHKLRSRLHALGDSHDVEVCGNLELKRGVLQCAGRAHTGGVRQASCAPSILSYHTHPRAAYLGAVYGWPGKTDMLNVCVAAINGPPLKLHLVVAVEGIYAMRSARRMGTCKLGHDGASECDRRRALLAAGAEIRAFDDSARQRRCTPGNFAAECTSSSIPIHMQFIPRVARADLQI